MNATRDFFSRLPPPAECLAILAGCAELTVFGLAGFANPAEWAKGYGLPLLPASKSHDEAGAAEASTEDERRADEARRSQIGYIAAVSARNLQNGVLMLAFACYTRDRRALGLATLANTITTVADAWIARTYGVSEASSGHLIGVFNSLAIGLALLRWRRDDPWW